MTDVPSITIGGVPIINLESPQSTYPAQSYTTLPSQQPPSYHTQAPSQQQQQSASTTTTQGSSSQPYIPHHMQQSKTNDQRAMSVEMMDVSGLSLSSPVVPGSTATTATTTYPGESDSREDGTDSNGGAGRVQSPVPQGMGRQPSAEEERLKDKVREAQEQASLERVEFSSCTDADDRSILFFSSSYGRFGR